MYLQFNKTKFEQTDKRKASLADITLCFQRIYRPYFRQNSGMTDLFFWMEPTTDTELLYHTLDLDDPVSKYARHLQYASMLAELYKDDVII